MGTGIIGNWIGAPVTRGSVGGGGIRTGTLTLVVIAKRISSVVLVKLSLYRRRHRWFATVLGESTRRAAMSVHDKPCANHPRTSYSRSESVWSCVFTSSSGTIGSARTGRAGGGGVAWLR